MKREDIYFQAVKSRDPRFDGKFFTGVKTTGIYCRPVCPAQPRRENMVFFTNAHEAERAGFRPCLRCRPESAPRSPAWIGASAIVRRAVKVLHHPETLDFDEERFAARFGVTARHLRRLFVEELGKTPKQLSSENRLNLARQLIVETSLPFAEVAFAAGFGSVRRFNDAFKLRFHKSPQQVRRRRERADEGTLTLHLAYRPPFDFAGLLASYDAHRIGDLEWVENDRYHRVIEAGGRVGRVSVSDEPSRSRLKVEIDFPDTSVIQSVVTRVRAMFDLDSDPVLVANALETDPATRALLRRTPGLRLPSGWDPFEIAVSTILGQLVTVEFGRKLVSDLITLLGRESRLERDGRKVRLFPRAEDIAASELRGLRTTSARKRTLRAFARAIADDTLSLEPTQDVEAFTRAIRGIPGIGPWTADYIALKALRHTDAFPHTDLILARALHRHPLARLEKMRPWRGYAAALYWKTYTTKRSPK